MRLKSIYEDHWQPISNHPGKLGKRDKRAKKNDMSFLVHPEDRKRWLKWFGGKKIKEDLDDKDVFSNEPTREEVGKLIDQLRAIAATPKAAAVLRTMEKMYAQLFGEPYNPHSTTPRM